MNNRFAINMIKSYSCSTQMPNNIYLGLTLIRKYSECAMMIISILEPLPTYIITSPSTSLYLFCNSYFELLILATEQVSNTQGLLRALVRYASITCISNIPLFTLASFLSGKYLGSSTSSDHFLCSRSTQF